jgi:hypothetical protein
MLSAILAGDSNLSASVERQNQGGQQEHIAEKGDQQGA